MSKFIAALPMYDWPERRADVDAMWTTIHDRLVNAGVDAPAQLTRDEADMHGLWLRPDLLLAQTCWGPMELGLADKVQLVGQPSYDGVDGGQGEFYSSAIVMRADVVDRMDPVVKLSRGPSDQPSEPCIPGIDALDMPPRADVPAPADGAAHLPVNLMRGLRFAYNSTDSMSGIIALSRDLQAANQDVDLFSERLETGGHRLSIRAVYAGVADIAAIDCLSWHLAKRLEPAAAALRVVGWTARRKGLPFITAKATPPEVVAKLREAVAGF